MSDAGIDIPGRQSDVYECTDSLVSSCVIGSICRSVEPLAQHRMIKDVLEPDFLLVEASTPVEEVVRLIHDPESV